MRQVSAAELSAGLTLIMIETFLQKCTNLSQFISRCAGLSYYFLTTIEHLQDQYIENFKAKQYDTIFDF